MPGTGKRTKMDGCLTCKWSAEFQFTKHKTPKAKNEPGRCKWPIEKYMPTLPTAFMLNFNGWPRPSAVWPGDGLDCACWASKSAAQETGTGEYAFQFRPLSPDRLPDSANSAIFSHKKEE